MWAWDHRSPTTRADTKLEVVAQFLLSRAGEEIVLPTVAEGTAAAEETVLVNRTQTYVDDVTFPLAMTAGVVLVSALRLRPLDDFGLWSLGILIVCTLLGRHGVLSSCFVAVNIHSILRIGWRNGVVLAEVNVKFLGLSPFVQLLDTI